MDVFQWRLDDVLRAGPFELPAAVKEFVGCAAALLRDNRNRIVALEREVETLTDDAL